MPIESISTRSGDFTPAATKKGKRQNHTMKSNVRLLWCGDAVTQTGFSRVSHNVLNGLFNTGMYDIHVLGVNYHGDPHNYPYKIYPAVLGGDQLGYKRLETIVKAIKPEVVVLFNDIWVILDYLYILKEAKLENFKTAIYFPVDAYGYDPEWMDPLYRVDKVLVYTEFAKQVLREAGFRRKVSIVPHGVDTNIYFPVNKSEARQSLNGLKDEDFIVFNANRNQPRKRIDTTIKAFCKFAKNKPDARLYLHMGLVDAGWSIIPLMMRECKLNGIESANKLILTDPNLTPGSTVSEELLNIIYNTADIGLNTSSGEGWGLVNFEQAACGVPQIVPGFAATAEIFKDRGLLLPARQYLSNLKINTEGGIIHEDDVVEALNTYYYDKELRYLHAAKMFEYTQQPQFNWISVAKLWHQHLQELV